MSSSLSLFTITCALFLLTTSYIPSYDKFCVSNSISPYANGTYEYSYFNPTTNASIYYNIQTDQYLFPLIVSAIDKQYRIGPNSTSFSAYSYCSISNTSPEYNFNPLDCTKGWTSYDPSTQQWTTNTNMRLINCNNICIKGYSKPFIWFYYDLNTNTSVYTDSNLYLSTANNQWHLYNDSIQIYNISDIETCTYSCINGIETPYYGIMKATHKSILNKGVINEVISWGVYNDNTYNAVFKSIGNFQFKSDNDYISDIFGSGGGSNVPYFDDCIPFKLETDDYINGYRVIYDEYVYALTFYTFQNGTYSCNATDLYYNEYHDSGVIYDDEYYLSGFNIHYEWIIDAISFQFHSIYNCTSTPTIYPTVYPSLNPTLYPSLNPTLYPTLTPTLNLTKSTTLHPTLRLEITPHPTQTPTILAYDTVTVSTEYESVDTNTDTNRQLIVLMLCTVAVFTVLIVIALCIGRCNGKYGNDKRMDDGNNANEMIERKITPPVSKNANITIENNVNVNAIGHNLPHTALRLQQHYTTSRESEGVYKSDSEELYGSVVGNADTTSGHMHEGE